MTDLERLVAIHDIKNLIARRVRALDARDWDAYAVCYAPEMTSASFKDAGDRAGMIAALQKDSAGVSTIHQVNSPEIHVLSETEATGTWTMEDRKYWKQGDEDHWMHGWGHYKQVYEKRDGEWLITAQTLVRTRVEHSLGSNRAN